MLRAGLLALLLLPAQLAAKLVVIGLTPEQESNVRALLPLASASCETGQWRVKRLFRDADDQIARALEALGYYHAVVNKTLSWEQGCWQAEFRVDPGRPVYLRGVDFKVQGEAANDAAVMALLQADQPQPGDILHHGKYDAFRDRARDRLIERGYFDAEYGDSRVVVDTQRHEANITLTLESGPRYRFGQVSYTGGILRQQLLEGYSDISSGDFYNARALTDLSTALSKSGYFGSVSVSTESPDPSTRSVDVNVRLTPGNRHVYRAGIGFATDTGAQGQLGYSNRRRSANGGRFESRLFLSEVKSEVSASYRWPRQDPRREWVILTAGFNHEDTETSESDAYKLGVSRSRRVSEKWLEKPYLELLYEDFTVGGERDSSGLLIGGFSWESVTGREPDRVTRGRSLSYDIRGAGRQLGSDTSFLQLRARGKWIRSFNADTRLLMRAKISTTLKEDFEELPPSVRFFVGGDRSIRGYDFESLGPRNDRGKVVGGAHVIETSVEVDHVVRGNWSLAGFVDSGSAFNERPEFFTGVGLGVRWQSPVGPIRVDLATALDDSDGGLRVHISMGPDL